MAWSTFFGVVLGAYAVYYTLNLLYDLFFSRRRVAAADAGVHYDVGELAGKEEQAYDLAGKEEGSSHQFGGHRYEPEPHGQQHIIPTPEPALRVEGQGIQLDEFLKEAKSYSSSIF